MLWDNKKIPDLIRNRIIQSEEVWILGTVQSFNHSLIRPVNNFLTKVSIFSLKFKIFSTFFTCKISNRIIVLILLNLTSAHRTKDIFFCPKLSHNTDFLRGTRVIFYKTKIESIHNLSAKHNTSSNKWLEIL